ncbi:hypothetical protein RJ640_010683 [Escallonia rubra]|uniref:GAG-pre-integrase domain-containing protein n=1 Tax=Escallonia rubra TaxID=112253 RepID=A0AA88RQ77_9ASTE|nr:hypothetical protein RJ640_010683 [Escallonia rubra]
MFVITSTGGIVDPIYRDRLVNMLVNRILKHGKQAFKEEIMRRYEMSDLGLLHHFLGMEIVQDELGFVISQKKYSFSVLKKFGHYIKDCPERKGKKKDNSKTADAGVAEDNSDGADVFTVTISSSDGGWILDTCSTVTGAATAAAASSSDIYSDTTKLWHMHLGHMSERGMDVLSKQGLLGSKKTGKLDFCEHCVFGKQCRVKFSQAVHTTKDDMKSTLGYCFSRALGIFSWISKKKQTVAQSTAEAEYVSIALATLQAIWLRIILNDVGEKQESATELQCDNKSAITMARNPVYHDCPRAPFHSGSN